MAVKSSDGDEVIVYFAENSKAKIQLNHTTEGDKAKGTWFNSSEGTAASAGEGHSRADSKEFTPPKGWPDAVLILESGNSPCPGL